MKTETTRTRSRDGRSTTQVLRATAREKLALWMSAQPRSIEQVRQWLEAHMGKPVPRRTAERYRDWMVDGYGAVAARTGDGRKGWLIEENRRAPLQVEMAPRKLARVRRAADWLQREGRTQWAGALQDLLAVTQDAQPSPAESAGSVLEAVSVRPGPQVQPPSWVESVLQRAMTSQHAIKVCYRLTKRSERSSRRGLVIDAVLHPYGLVYGDRTFLVGGYEAGGRLGRTAEGERKIGWYLLDRFESIQITEIPLLGRGQFDLGAYVRQWFGTPRGDEEPFKVEWQFSPQVAERASLYNFHSSQKRRRLDDGSLIVSFMAAGSLEMDWHLHTWGDEVKVLQPPPEAFQRMVRQQRALWREYFR